MAEEATSASEIQINIKGPSELKLQISITTDKTVLELKQAIAQKSDVEAERQRLIYSGRVLKDEDQLSVYKIQSQHTIHMVKGAARSGASSTPAAPQPLPTMQAGQNPADPLTMLNGYQGFGAMAGLNPFADMGLNPNDPNMMQTMMNSPEFLQQMSSMLSNPQVVEQMIAANPQMASMAPYLRETLQSPQFQELLRNPQAFQQMMNMSNQLRNAGVNPFGMPGLGGGGFGAPGGAAGGFPAPGTPNTTGNANTTTTNPQTPPAPGAAAAGVPPFNPFSLFGGPGAGLGAGAGAGAGTGQAPALNPFDPAMLQQMQQIFGGPGLGGAFGGAPAAPADTRPPEERFQVQLQQLQDMGFSNASQNVRALLATGGNVHSAIEYILGGGGL